MIVKATHDQWNSKGFFVVKKVDSPSVIQNVTAQYGTASPRSGTRQSGASPLVLLTLVVCLLSALTAMAWAAMGFSDPWSKISARQEKSDTYVDDTSSGVSDAVQDDPMCISARDSGTS